MLSRESEMQRLSAILMPLAKPALELTLWRGIGLGLSLAVGLALSSPAAAQDGQIAGAESVPDLPESTQAASMISGLPIGLFLDATDNISSSIDLGQCSIDHLRTTVDPEDLLPSPYPDFDLPPTSGKHAPGRSELDIIELLPDLDDGGELL